MNYKNINFKITLIFSCFLSLGIFGQKFATSPFSSYGIGEFGTLDHPSFGGIGNANVAAIDSINLNFFNPSSYSSLAHGQPLFSTGISTRFSTYTENGNSYKTGLTGINHFALAIPFARRFGLAFGVKPFARTGYSINDYTANGTDTVNYTYTGNGSFNEVFTGFSVKVLNIKNNKLSLGTNLGYVFGNTTNERLSNLSTLISGGIESSKYQIKSIRYDLGLNYILSFNKTSRLVLAGTYSPAQALQTTKDFGIFYAEDVTDSRTISDTISSLNEKGQISMPSTMNLGFSYSFRPKVDSSYNKVKVFQLTFYGAYSATDWSSYKTNFANENANTFLNTTKYSAGIEFIPHYNYFDRTKAIGYFSRIRYKAGFQYATLPLERLSKQLTDMSASVGLSFPIVSQRSVSSLNLSFVAGNRGNGDAKSLNEKYYGINFGISIAPGVNDRWFRKYKID
ncbi:MAG: hypothetical protein V4622_09810 [Bacteroidota bacterium]